VSLGRLLLALLGRRLPRTRGTLAVEGLEGPVTIRRDGCGIPHIDAGSDADVWYALGFCHAQDRGFQLEMLLRAGRGTLAELSGPDALPVDRFSRRAGIHRAAAAQLEVVDSGLRSNLEAYARGVNAGFRHGCRGRPHELALARARPTPWTAVDSLASGKLLALGLAANWDMELGRLKVLTLDGPDALRAVDPAYPEWLAVTAPPAQPAGPALDRLGEDIAALAGVAGVGGGSNNWALAASRTATGRPLLANDPHLPPTLPSPWYLAHLRTPEWALAGAGLVGSPTIGVGHNGHAAWGATNGGADCVDLFLEEVSLDGRSVRDGDGWAACEVREERIAVRGAGDVVERVLVTPRGPVVGPALADGHPAVSLRAVWLEPEPIEGLLRVERVRDLDGFRARLRYWPFANFNLVYADTSGRIAWQLAGALPRRTAGHGLLPRPGREAGRGWEGWLEPDELPWLADPEEGWLASANNKPVADRPGAPFLGADWMDGYRVQRIAEALSGREDWDVDATLRLQRDELSLPWRDVREALLGAPREDRRTRRAVDLLAGWDGVASAGSAAATVFELTMAELAVRAARAKAPRSVEWALGRGASPLNLITYVALRQVGHVAGLLRERPEGWFEAGWDAEVASALASVVERLEREHGPDPAGWAWGRLRTLTLRHPFGARRPLDRAFNLGPIPCGGDTNTVSQASFSPLDPLADPYYHGTLRMVVDVGEWDRSRAALAGGQSGNPLSPHYSDQFERWRRGEGVPLAFTEPAVARATRATLRLEPAGAAGAGRG
jgi:penicillin amidase